MLTRSKAKSLRKQLDQIRDHRLIAERRLGVRLSAALEKVRQGEGWKPESEEEIREEARRTRAALRASGILDI